MTARLVPSPLTLSLSKGEGEGEPCPKLLAETLADMVRRAIEIIGRDPEAELPAVQAELVARYGFAPDLVEARAARIVAQARRIRADRAVKRAQRREEAGR